jgi:hypothetical protein
MTFLILLLFHVSYSYPTLITLLSHFHPSSLFFSIILLIHFNHFLNYSSAFLRGESSVLLAESEYHDSFDSTHKSENSEIKSVENNVPLKFEITDHMPDLDFLRSLAVCPNQISIDCALGEGTV